MKVSQKFQFNEFVKAATIASTAFEIGKDLVVAGWGDTSEGGTSSPILLKVTIPYVPTAECEKLYPNLIVPGMICAGTDGKDSCDGDSGGPLHSGETVVGVVSWSFECADPKHPGVYASVPFYSNWIRDNTK